MHILLERYLTAPTPCCSKDNMCKWKIQGGQWMRANHSNMPEIQHVDRGTFVMSVIVVITIVQTLSSCLFNPAHLVSRISSLLLWELCYQLSVVTMAIIDSLARSGLKTNVPFSIIYEDIPQHPRYYCLRLFPFAFRSCGTRISAAKQQLWKSCYQTF